MVHLPVNTKVIEIENLTTDITNLVEKSDFSRKVTEIGFKAEGVFGLVIKTSFNTKFQKLKIEYLALLILWKRQFFKVSRAKAYSSTKDDITTALDFVMEHKKRQIIWITF